jgi:hypothetical protein
LEHSAPSTTLVRPDPTVSEVDQGFSDPPMPSVTTRPRLPSGRRPGRRRLAGASVFAFCFAIYFTIALLLDFKYTTFSGDAFSRMANGYYILYSRDPHLAAVGFVWTPLTSLADMVFLLGNHIWPALSHNDVAGSLTSSVAMAGAAYQVYAAFREWGVNLVIRLCLTAGFALDPMILYYGGNGMSEGLYIFTLTAATRYLIRWIHVDDIRSLAYAGTALGFSYLTRNEAAGAIAAGTVAVALVSYWQHKEPRKIRRATALADATIFAIPGAIAAVGWAICSFIITGSFFGQLSSLYGNTDGRVFYEVHAIFSLWPAIPVVFAGALLVALLRRDPRILAPLGVLGGALGFDMAIYLKNDIQPYYRYFLITVPVEVFMLGIIVAAIVSSRPGPRQAKNSRPRLLGRVLRNGAAILLILGTMSLATVTTAAAMFNPQIGPEETQQLGFIFDKHLNSVDIAWKARYPTIIRLGSYFAHLNLPDGDIVVDNSTSCVPEMIVTIRQPKLFVIPNNRDFQRTLADPIAFHAHYILEPNPAINPITAPNIEFPTLWATGDHFAKSVHQFPSHGTCPEFRLFKVLHHPTQALG